MLYVHTRRVALYHTSMDSKGQKEQGEKGTKNYESKILLMISISVVVFEMKL